jgi:two-component system, cell cycle response regulator DivK
LLRTHPRQAKTNNQREAAVANELILIVEDNDVNRTLLRDVLQFKGFRTAEAPTAEIGIQLARDMKPALILMDFQLPGMNGIEAFNVLRGDASTSAIPVIAVTASAMTADRQRMMDAGFDGIETKPIHVLNFLESVGQVLRKKANQF